MDSFGFKLLLLLHIVTIVVAFAPGFVIPGLRRKIAALGDGPAKTFAGAAAGNDLRIHGPALVLAGVFGFGLVGMSDKFYDFSKPWISVAMLIWFVMMGLVFGVLVPAERKVAAGDATAQKLVGMAGGIIHLLFLIQVIIMIWKPGQN